MNEKDIWQYISRKFSGEITPKEEAFIKKWREADDVNNETYKRVEQVWANKTNEKINTNHIYKSLQYRISEYQKKQKNTRFIYYFQRIAAIFFFLIVSVFIIKNYLMEEKQQEIVYQEIHVPRGSRTSIILSDSTKVWLSNDSKLKYPSTFNGDYRELELSGEAYFEVAHNEKRPFIVNIGDNRIKVIGTVFSVTAYPGDNTVKTDLISGSIQFDILVGSEKNQYKSYKLKPSESVVLDKTTGKLYEAEVLADFYDYWEKGVYVFTNESLENLANKISRIYNVEVVFGNEVLKSKRFSGILSVNDNIFTFFEAIKRTSIEPVEYSYDDNKIYIKLKN